MSVRVVRVEVKVTLIKTPLRLDTPFFKVLLYSSLCSGTTAFGQSKQMPLVVSLM